MNNILQRQFTLTVPRLPGETQTSHRYRVRDLNESQPKRGHSAGELLARLLKVQASRVMADITECPPLSLPSHLDRLNDLREVIQFAMRNDLVSSDEKELSGKQLLYAATLADFLACLEITRKQHRAPAFVNHRDQDLQRIWHGIELLAGMISEQKGVPMPEGLTNTEGEDER